MQERLYITKHAIWDWMVRYKKASVKTGTYTRLEHSYTLMKRYSIADKDVRTLKSADIQDYLLDLTNDGYALTTIKKQYNLITGYMRYAIAEGICTNPIYTNVKLPREVRVQKHKIKSDAFTRQEQVKLLTGIKSTNSMGSVASLLLLETGMRAGELLALTWDDIMWERKAVNIHKTAVNHCGRKSLIIQEGAKSESSNRIIPLNDKVMRVLESMYYGQDGFIFAAEDGRCIGYNTLRKQMQEMFASVGVRYRGMHAFRHTFATNCYYKGCDVKILSKLLGHASVTITYNTYIHLYGDALEEMRAIVN